MAGNDKDDPLAYGEYHERGPGEDGDEHGGGDRGLIGDTYRKYRDKHQQSQPGTTSGAQQSSGLASSIFNTLHGAVQELGSELDKRLTGKQQGQPGQRPPPSSVGAQATTQNRFGSFARQESGNDAKWYVDGCGYMWAVSVAIEQASESIWILDWWLSPELYLRRPPARNEQYRIDRMLQAAAQRGVKVNIIVYKEVTQALTRKYLSPTLPRYLHSLIPHHTDAVTRTLSGLGLAATFAALEHVEAENALMAPILSVSSSHTKHHLENLHPNISCFRHPDHLPDAQTLQSSFLSSLQNISLTAKKAASLPADALKAIYGMNEDVILYWAHHEKLCLIDGKTAFMGGLDLCFGRWDLNQHPIADCHPGKLDDIVFPGQDWNNARIADFHDVAHPDGPNALDRTTSARMGWSDISISLHGPVVEDLKEHFVQRWNFIYNEKYDVRKDTRYHRLTLNAQALGANPQQSYAQISPENRPYQAPPVLQQSSGSGSGSQPYQAYRPSTAPSAADGSSTYQPYRPLGESEQSYGQSANPPYGQSSNESYNQSGYQQQQQSHQAYGSGGAVGGSQPQGQYYPPPPSRGMDEDDERGKRGFGEAPQEGQHHHHREEIEEQARALGGRFESKMERAEERYAEHARRHPEVPQVGSIPCQIVRSCTKWSHGVPTEHSVQNAYCEVIRNSQHFVYIENQFFITATGDKQKPVKNLIGAAIVERILRAARAGEKYKVIVLMPSVPAFAGDLKDDSSLGTRAIMEFQYNSINRGGHSIMEEIGNAGHDPTEYIRFYNLRNYDRINANASGRWDTVSECYMLDGPDIRSVPWQYGELSEIDAFVSEELYIHSKVLIADDRIVICGSANLNDRSQLGDHDSEIACVIEDPTPVDSYMNGRPWRATKFAVTLRRQLFRKHLGLLRSQDMERPNQNFEPVGLPNVYDWGSEADRLVADPLSDAFLNRWNSQARQNTYAFGKIFHPVPHDDVRTWQDYDQFYEQYFHEADEEADSKTGKNKPAKYRWGHVVTEVFSPGEQGLREVKDLLSTIKGTLVEMPLLFLIKEDIAKEGLSLNAFTEEVYT